MQRTLTPPDQAGSAVRGEDVSRFDVEFYRALIESGQDVIIVLDIDGTILYALPSVEPVLGYDPSELTGQNLADFVHPDSRSDLKGLLEQSVFGQRSVSRAPLISVLLKDDSFRSFEVAAKILRSKSRPLGIVVTAHDATNLGAAERALRKQEEEYSGLFQNMLEGFAYCRMLYDAGGLPVDWIYLDTNTAFERITGLANARGRRGTEVIPGIQESNPELFEIYGRVAQNGQPARFETKVESLGTWFDMSVFCPSQEHFVAVFQDITQRKQVEAALRQGRNTLAQIMNSLPQAVFWKDRDGVYLGCNNVFARSAGVSSVDAIVGKTDFDLPWPRHEAEAYRADDREVVEHNNPKLHIVEPIQQADGTRLWIDTSKVPLTDETGQVRGVLGVYEDITERKRAEEALQESEIRYRTLFTGAGEGIVATDLETMQFRYANPCMCRMFGYTEEEFMRLGIADIHPRGSWDSILTEIEARVRGEKTGSDTIPCLHKNGTVFYAELSPAVLDGSKCIWAFFTDVTERKRAEEALRESEERFSRAIHATEEGLWEWDILTGQEFFSPRWCEIIGYSFDEAELPHTYDSWAGRIHPDDSERVSSALKNHLEKGTRYDVDYRHRHKSGEYHWQNSKGKASVDESGKPVRMTGCISDITERMQAESIRAETLERQKRMNQLQQALLAPGELVQKLKMITDGVVDIFSADFCRIWITKAGDLCELGCMHAAPTEGPHACHQRDRCLRLMASSGRYTHTDGAAHRRVPFGAYKIGRIASGEEHRFLTNDVASDPRVHNHDWAKELGLVSFAGYQLRPPGGETLGVLALFSTQPITPEEDAQLDSLSAATARVVIAAQTAEALRESEQKHRMLFESSRDAIMILAPPDWRFTKANPATLEMFRAASESHVTSCGPWDVSPQMQPDGRPSSEKARAMIETAMREGFHFFEWTHRRLDGEVFTADVLLTRMDLAGQTVLQATVRDITERQQSLLRRSVGESRTLSVTATRP